MSPKEDPRLSAFAKLLLQFDSLKISSEAVDFRVTLEEFLKQTFGALPEDERIIQFRELLALGDSYASSDAAYVSSHYDQDWTTLDGVPGSGAAAQQIVENAIVLLRKTGLAVALTNRGHVAARSDGKQDKPFPPSSFLGGDEAKSAEGMQRLFHQFLSDVAPMFLPSAIMQTLVDDLASQAAGDVSILRTMRPAANRKDDNHHLRGNARSLAVLYARLRAPIERTNQYKILERLAEEFSNDYYDDWIEDTPRHLREKAGLIGKKLRDDKPLTADETEFFKIISRYEEETLRDRLKALPRRA